MRALKMIQPDYPSAMGLLSHLNSDELKEMLNDDTKFDSVLKDVKQVKINKKKLFCCPIRVYESFRLSGFILVNSYSQNVTDTRR